jgi:hypothetical protein
MGMELDGDEVYRKDRTVLEIEADANAEKAPNPNPLEVVAMPVKPGWKTSEFWLHLAVGAVIAFLAFTVNDGLPAIAAQLPTAGVVGSILLLLLPMVKMGLGWLLTRLSTTYDNNRTEQKTTATEAGAGATPPAGG